MPCNNLKFVVALRWVYGAICLFFVNRELLIKQNEKLNAKTNSKRDMWNMISSNGLCGKSVSVNVFDYHILTRSNTHMLLSCLEFKFVISMCFCLLWTQSAFCVKESYDSLAEKFILIPSSDKFLITYVFSEE